MVKMKNATCMALPRPRFICRKGRSKSIDAPIVPIKFARMLLLNRNVTFASGEAGRGMCKWIAPKECADHNNESRVFAGGMLHAGRAVWDKDVVAARCPGQERT